MLAQTCCLTLPCHSTVYSAPMHWKNSTVQCTVHHRTAHNNCVRVQCRAQLSTIARWCCYQDIKSCYFWGGLGDYVRLSLGLCLFTRSCTKWLDWTGVHLVWWRVIKLVFLSCQRSVRNDGPKMIQVKVSVSRRAKDLVISVNFNNL